MFWSAARGNQTKLKLRSYHSISLSSFVLAAWWKEDVSGNLCVTGKAHSFHKESVFFPLAHGYDLLEHSLFSKNNPSSGVSCVCVCVPVYVSLSCRCVLLPEGERALVQLSGSDHVLTRPPSVHTKPDKPRLAACGRAQGEVVTPACVWLCDCVCVCVSARVHVSHM